jgi:hypothetical protein
MNQYLLSVCYPAGATQPPPAALEKITKDVTAINREMQDAGVWVFAGALHPPHTATVIEAKGGEVLTTDGPFIESKEQIGGISIIRVTDLDAALAWAGKLSRATSTPIEVRPLQAPHA